MDDIVQELREVIEELGYFPMGSKLDKMGKSDLRGAIQRQGGQLVFGINWVNLEEEIQNINTEEPKEIKSSYK